MKKVLSILFIALIFGLGCTDQKAGYLVGKWEDVPRVVDSQQRYVWTFKDDNNFSVEVSALNPETGDIEIESTLTGEYEFKRESFEYRLILNMGDNNPGLYPINGEYWVEEIDRTSLKITRDKFIGDETGTPFIRRELIKL